MDLADAIALIESEQANEDRQLTCGDMRILVENKHWKTSGFKPTSLETFGYRVYEKMVYLMCNRIVLAKVREVKIQTLPTDDRPLSDPQQGLFKPPWHGGWVHPTDSAPMVTVECKDPQDPKLNWAIGVESEWNLEWNLWSHSGQLFHPGILKCKEIPCATLSCKWKTQTYMVNISTPLENDFRHIKLLIGDFPTLTRADIPKMQLVIKSRQTFCLGTVTTIQNVKGLLLHKLFANKLLQAILALHTSLQVHPIVPRTFTLHLMKTPFPHKSVVGMFVCEAAGKWNLGCARRLNMTMETEKFTLAYHVLQCLLRVTERKCNVFEMYDACISILCV